MTSPREAVPRSLLRLARVPWIDVALFTAIALVVLAIQARSGAWHADLAFDPDEPSHAVSSLMVRDYLAEGPLAHPKDFAFSFYQHYPKVAIGHWPPLFYIAEALWMRVAGRTRVAMLLFVALSACALLWSVFTLVRRKCSTPAALVAVAVVLWPLYFQQMIDAVHPEVLLALWMLWAVVFFARWMEARAPRDAVAALVFSLAALGTHGRGAALLLLPAVLLPLSRRAPRWTFALLPAAIAVVVWAPHALAQTDPFGFSDALYMHRFYLTRPWPTLHLWLLPVVAGFLLALSPARRADTFWAAMASIVLSGYLFLVLVPVHWDDRYLISSLPAFGALAALAAQTLMDRFPTAARRRQAGFGVAVISVASIAWTVAHVAPKRDSGYAAFVRSATFAPQTTVLIDADGRNEGALVAETSLLDPHRQRTVLRGSKTLAHTNWVLRDFRLQYSSTQEELDGLDALHVGLVLVQQGYVRSDVSQLQAALNAASERWQELPSTDTPQGLTAYRRIGTHP